MEVGVCTRPPQEAVVDTGGGGAVGPAAAAEAGHTEREQRWAKVGRAGLAVGVGGVDDLGEQGRGREGFPLETSPAANCAGAGPLDCRQHHRFQIQSRGIRIGPRTDLRTQLEMDKDDESLMRWKRNLLGQAAEITDQSVLEPEVEVLSFKVMVKGRPDILIPLAKNGTKAPNFVLKEKSIYRVQFEFMIRKNIVLGLTYINDVFRHGRPVEETEEMMGTYAPQDTAYVFLSEEETTPSGWFAKGHYTAHCRFVDDDGRCYADFSYSFDIRKDWD
ncbi:hypothetical protein CBR_g50391 [Chara braunii]|uniref:Rho GDP-dissociation inhibitor 1 n=1 Tax=Chara braunii TaxID=69332 RepID=A0A388M6Y6_CHABU|nr:hypothetical protein CBR_g50391 [Chara braunii]|eukprot:GBG90212.1 hypothetical protein CBR_g50391 [Chara braunii]